MNKWKKALLGLLLLCGTLTASATAFAAEGLKLYTAYTSLSVPPGERIGYTVDLINNTDDIRTADLSFDAGGNGWEYELTSGGHAVKQVAVKPNESLSLNLSLTVPLEVNKGDYSFRLVAGDFGTLPLRVNVSEQGSYKSEFTVDQPNRQGHSDTTFTYSLQLANHTASDQQYALAAQYPSGWDARFAVDGTNVTSVDIEAGSSKTVTLSLTPADKAVADTYPISVGASGGGTDAQINLEAVITGTYGIELNTADERLSADITAGKERKLELSVSNTGSAELTDVSLTASSPANWEVTFEPKTITSIQPGQSVPVTATIKSSGKALAGDYVVSLSADSAAKSANVALRMTVKSSVLWGWIGVLIIAVVLVGIYYLFRKYGRR